MKYNIYTNSREEMIDITEHINKFVKDSGFKEGVVIVYVPHTTAGLTINENADPSVKKDILGFMRNKVPKDYNFSHVEGNSDAHIKSSLFGCSLNLIVSNGKLLLGTWQSVYFCEFDGPRNRTFFIKIIDGK